MKPYKITLSGVEYEFTMIKGEHFSHIIVTNDKTVVLSILDAYNDFETACEMVSEYLINSITNKK